MEYLVYGRDSDMYRIDTRSKEEILKPSDECGSIDSIYLSWEDGEREEVLYKFLTGADKKPLDVEKEINEGQTKEELIMGTHVYFSITRSIINNLYESKNISESTNLELIKQNKTNEKKQLKRIKSGTSIFKLLTLKSNENDKNS